MKAFKGVRATSGAVSVINDKGEVSMEKVKVRSIITFILIPNTCTYSPDALRHCRLKNKT